MPSHREFMELALREAEKGRGKTRPNPLVGCVIVKRGKVVATGFHAQAGGEHAEIVALKRAKAATDGAVMYVNLEPCDHEGKTGPCTRGIIELGIKKVYVSMGDPNPLVNGRGLQRLRRAGVSVEVGLMAEEAHRLNEEFDYAMRTGRPFVTAKIAQSLDGRSATRTGESQWITSKGSREIGHQLRSQVDGIIVGVNTVRLDDPRLTARVRGGTDPVRIIFDTHGRTPPKSKVVRLGKRSPVPTLIFVSPKVQAARRTTLEKAGAQTITCPLKGGRIHVSRALEHLGRMQFISVLVEGGPTVTGSFFDEGRINKLHVFIAPLVIGGEKAPASVGAKGVARLSQALRLRDMRVDAVGDDLHIVGYPPTKNG